MNKMMILMGRGKWVFLFATLVACGGSVDVVPDMASAGSSSVAAATPRGPTRRTPNCDDRTFLEMAIDHPPCPEEKYGLGNDVCAFDASFLLVDLDSPDARYAFGCEEQPDGTSRWIGHAASGAP